MPSFNVLADLILYGELNSTFLIGQFILTLFSAIIIILPAFVLALMIFGCANFQYSAAPVAQFILTYFSPIIIVLLAFILTFKIFGCVNFQYQLIIDHVQFLTHLPKTAIFPTITN